MSRAIEHIQSQNTDIARRSSVPKRCEGAAPISSHMMSQTRGTLGAPGSPTSGPDASSASPLDPSRQGKAFPIPQITQGCKSDPERGSYDPGLAHAIMDEAKRPPDDFARDLHTVLPGQTKEN